MAWRCLSVSLREMGPQRCIAEMRRCAEKAHAGEARSPVTGLGGHRPSGAEHSRLSEVLAGPAWTLRRRAFKPGPRAATGAQPVPLPSPHSHGRLRAPSPQTLWGRSASRGSPQARALQTSCHALLSRGRLAPAWGTARTGGHDGKGMRSAARTRARLSDSSWSHQACPGDSSRSPGAHGAALGP